MREEYFEMIRMLKPPKPSKRSQGKVIRCEKCHCTGKTLIARGPGYYICRDCLAKGGKTNV